MTVANCITLARLLLAPVFVYFFIIGEKHTALVIFCVAGGTDLIDGMVARLMKQRSRHGAILDPMADKVLLASAFVCLVVVGVLPLWFLILALVRDIMITGGLIYFRIKKAPLPYRAIWSSKFATFFMLATVVSGLIWWWSPQLMLFSVGLKQLVDAFMFASATLVIISGILYVRMGFAILEKNS